MSLREWTGAASTAEKAVEKGLKKLGLRRDRVEIQVLGEKTSGLFSLFGFRSMAVKLVEKPDPRRERDRFDEGRGRGFRDRGPRDRGFREGGRDGRRDERRGGRREEPRRDEGSRRRGRDDRPRDGFLRNDAGAGDTRHENNSPRPSSRDGRRDQRPGDARPRGRGPSEERPRENRSRDDQRRGRRPEPAANRSSEPRAPRGDVARPDDILNEWKSLLGWDLSWSSRNGESGDIVIVFDAASGEQLMENGGRALEALEHLVNVARAKGDRGVPRVIFQIEGQAPREVGGVVGQAFAAADEVKRTGERVRLAPMDPRQRRLVHQALASHPDVETASEGEGPGRRIVIKPKNK